MKRLDIENGLARLAYSSLLRLGTPLYLARLWWRGRREPGYRQAWLARLGIARGVAPEPGRLWLHAVSLGETRAAAALIEALRTRSPGLRLLLTHGTATGRNAGQALLRQGDQQTWLPYDTPGAVRRFLRHHRPAVGVLMETEVWPNLLHLAREAGVILVLANGRLSERSEAKGRRLAILMHPALACFDRVLAQTEADAFRLRASGAREVHVLGNLKYDVTPSPQMLALGRSWRSGRLGIERPVVLAAVTREGEEAALLRAWRELPASRPLLCVVPRHPQRFDEVAALISQAGFTLARRSAWGLAPRPEDSACDVWLGDSLGEMPAFYAAADVALLGGSFEPLGGQNLIEAAACGCPLVMGPHTFNFAQAAEQALAAGAALRVDDIGTAVAAALDLIRSSGCEAMAQRALVFAHQHRGSADASAREILALAPNIEPSGQRH